MKRLRSIGIEYDGQTISISAGGLCERLKAPWYFIHIQILGLNVPSYCGERNAGNDKCIRHDYQGKPKKALVVARFSDLVVGTWKKLDMATGLDLS